MILGGDLGGTKTLLALAEVIDGRIEIVRQQRYASRDFASFDDLLAEFLTGSERISAACFGVAGPTDGRIAKLTYLPWQLTSGALEQKFAIGRVALINDFAAAAHGLPLVDDKDILTLHAGQPEPQAPRVILGAGTGLGVAGLIWQNGHYQVIPGEGGHFGFSPQTAEQGELWQSLLGKSGRVTVEDIVSGPGLSRIFAFFSGRHCACGWNATAPLPATSPRTGWPVVAFIWPAAWPPSCYRTLMQRPSSTPSWPSASTAIWSDACPSAC